MPVTRSTGLLALSGIALAALLTVIGHLEVNDDLNPWALTISDFAVSDRGGVIDVAMVVLALATVALLYGLRRAGPPRPRSARTAELLLGAWVGGLLLAAVVPTERAGHRHDHRRLPAPVRLGRRLPGAAGQPVGCSPAGPP